ncbi:MAG: family 10 glycosylhydrolase [Verrucomicrobiota bacterium]
MKLLPRILPLLPAAFSLLTSLAPAQEWRRSPAPADAVPAPAREFRAAWVATVYNLDWPSKPGLSDDAQRMELRRLLDNAVTLGLNAVIFQIRPAADALYASKLEPWSAVLTGRQGQAPGYDPLAFAVTEAHRRGLELHAWFNPFRARAGAAEVASGHFSLRHPEWMRMFNKQMWMDPGEPGVQRHILEVMKDVVTRYDVDGVHIDDYFYPYPLFDSSGNKRDLPLGDEETWKQYGQGMEPGDWRRQNINRFVRSLYTMVKATRPAVRVGISPFGILRPGVPEGIKAKVDATRHLYGDSRLWLQEGWCDYFTPQLYWRIQPPDQSFTTLLAWWTAQSSRGRPVWPGISADRLSQGKSAAEPASEILDQIALTRKASATPGAVMWRMKSLTGDKNGIGTLLKEKAYAAPALPPAAPWLGQEVPPLPAAVKITPAAGGFRLSWSPAASNDPRARWWLVQTQAERAGEWSTAALCFRDRMELQLEKDITAAAIRAVSPSGITGPAILMEKP